MRSTILLLLSGLSFVSVAPVVVHAQTAPIAGPSPRDTYADHIAEAARRFELPATWIRAVLRTESAGDPRALSPKGAIGLMQIMPDTWTYLRIRHRLGGDPYDPRDNIIAGSAYIRELFDRYGSPGWIAAYNAGPGRYEASLRGRPLPAETRAYVAIVATKLDGNSDLAPVLIATADPQSWTRAPLFIVQPSRTAAADPVPGERSPLDGQSAATVRDVSAIAPLSAGLFVVRAAERTAP